MPDLAYQRDEVHTMANNRGPAPEINFRGPGPILPDVNFRGPVPVLPDANFRGPGNEVAF
jgi:hypothetical protein